MSRCEIVLVRNTQDATGYPCARDSSEECGECGTPLCNLHAESCDLCRTSLCAACFLIHMRQPHAKPAVPSSAEEAKRRAVPSHRNSA